jgi:hypothetical protein
MKEGHPGHAPACHTLVAMYINREAYLRISASSPEIVLAIEYISKALK